MPMQVAEALQELRRRGARMSLEDGRIRVAYRVPADAAPAVAQAIAVLRQHKQEALICLATRTGARHNLHWPPPSLEAERKFDHPAARLYAFLNRQVRTPHGTGRLLQVFGDRAAVLLDTELTKPQTQQRMSFFNPTDICPAGVM